MKYLLNLTFILAVVLITVNVVNAQGVHVPGTGITNPSIKIENQATGQKLLLTPTTSPASSQDQLKLRTFIQEQDRILEKERINLQDKDRLTQQDQDRTRLGVKVLIEAQQTIEGIDPKVEELANQIQNTVQNTIRSEKRIRERNLFYSFLFGGDKVSAREMFLNVTQNQERLQEILRLTENCGCGEDVKNVIREQIKIMQQEQTRLYQVVQNELNKNGLFSWFMRG